MNLLEQAKKMSMIYKSNPKLDVIFVGGSVSRGWDDRFSDIELFLIWDEPPDDEDRMDPIKAVNGTILDFHPYEEGEWSETYLADGTKFEISSFLTSTIEAYIQSMTKGDISLDKQCLIGAFADGLPLKGERQFGNHAESLFPYPKILKDNLILHFFNFDGRWQNREALIHRRDSLFLHSLLVEVSQKLIITLSAVNDMYIHHPGLKWLRETCERMGARPDHLTERIHRLLTYTDPARSVEELEGLIAETGQLLQDRLPHLDLTDQLERAKAVRPGVKGD
ncbi:cytoplasmic protein [Pseudalkalibacillus salsuginis]|uniref:cytoplasmic protein n=1 Tax=Pseudalkalibacillus salsuginis TaxID=2910972 RepID=UPI001F2BB1C4|nr:cytoplasmic protein [Pseudalkalibacillus salsuginis]MCF6410828.1 cytoplasmic protein [Pseudalkalibacillus salsuginis]